MFRFFFVLSGIREFHHDIFKRKVEVIALILVEK
jgi:hypothetical protein